MSVKEQNYVLEDRIMTTVLNKPSLLLSVPFDIGIFSKWKDVIAVMRTQLIAGVIPDIGTISQALPELNEYAQDQLAELIWDSKAKSTSFNFYIDELTRGATELKIYAELKKAVSLISADILPSQVISQLSTLHTALFHDIGRRRVLNSDLLITDADEHLMEMEQNKHRYKLRFGIPLLDRYYQGLHPTNLIVVGARVANGKTAFGTTIATNLARQNYKVGFISTEMTAVQVTFRCLSLISGVEFTKIQCNEIAKDSNDWIKLNNAKEDFRKFKFSVYEGSVTVQQIAAQARAWMATQGLDILIIDYLTKIKMEKPGRSVVEEVGYNVTAIKDLAKDIKIPIVLLAQLNRKAHEKRPSIAELKDSGVIEQEADSILLLSKPTKENPDDETGIIVGKNRHGPCGKHLGIEFDGLTMRWHSE